MKGIEVRSIDPSMENARCIQRLILEQHIAGDFPKPKRYADPYNIVHIAHQMERLEKASGDYAGIYIDDILAGLIQVDDWTVDRELEFEIYTECEPRSLFQGSRFTTEDSRKLAIATFAVDEKRTGDLYEQSAEWLLDMAVDRAVQIGGVALYATFHENDPLSTIALHHGLQFTGRISEPMAYQNVLHRLYAKPLDY